MKNFVLFHREKDLLLWSNSLVRKAKRVNCQLKLSNLCLIFKVNALFYGEITIEWVRVLIAFINHQQVTKNPECGN